MKRIALIVGLTAIAGVAIAAPAIQNAVVSQNSTAQTQDQRPAADRPPSVVKTVVPAGQGDTPMAQRMATIGILNKRNGPVA